MNKKITLRAQMASANIKELKNSLREGPLFDEVRDRVARVYTLHPHGRPESSNYEVRITNDYFGHDL